MKAILSDVEMMNQTKLNSMKPKVREYTMADRDGLHIRVRPSGAMSWLCKYTYQGKQYKLTIGKYNQKNPDAAWSLDDARDRAAQIQKWVAQGINPKIAIIRENEEKLAIEKKSRETFEHLLDEFDDMVLSKRQRPERPRQMLKNDVLPYLKNKPCSEITRKEVLGILDRVRNRKHSRTLKPGAPTSANRLMSLLKQLFKFAAQRDWIEYSPIMDLNKSAVGGVEKSRDRALGEVEIRQLMAQLSQWRTSEQNVLFIKFLLASGQRIDTCGGACWSEFDLDNAVWYIPPSDENRATKTDSNNCRRVPLSKYLINILKRQYKYSAISEYVWPPLRGNDYSRAFNHGSINILIRSNKFGGLNHWTPHDLRRTMTTRMAEEMQIPPHIPEKICGHVMQGSMAIYNRAEYFKGQVKALNAWGDYLTMLENSNVIPMKSGYQ